MPVRAVKVERLSPDFSDLDSFLPFFFLFAFHGHTAAAVVLCVFLFASHSFSDYQLSEKSIPGSIKDPKFAPSPLRQHAGTATAGGKDKDVHTREKIGDAGEQEKPAINQHARQRVSLRKDFVPSSFPPIHRNGYTAVCLAVVWGCFKMVQ